MAAGWFRDTSDNKLAGAADSELTPPTGHDFVLKSAIEAVYDGEIWDGGTWIVTGGVGVYTPPADILVDYDSTTDSGAVKDAAHTMMDVFDAALDYIHDNRFAWSDDARSKAIDGIHWQIINSARVALNSTRTHARRQKFCEESASWPDGVNGEARQYVDAIAADDTLTTPTKDWCWVNPETDPYVRHAVGNASDGFNMATNVENAPSSAKLIGRGWISEIP